MLSVKVVKSLGGFRLDASLSAVKGGITALVGPSGSGKTSLINAIAGLSKPDAGRIALDELVLFDAERRINLPPEQRQVGYVFQEGRLFPHMSVAANLVYGMKLLPPERRRLALDDVVALMGIGHLMKRRPARLSGGEKQRVAVGRALLTSPRLLLMDEPLASLDQERKEEILPFLARLPRQLDMPILYVSHSPQEVRALNAQVVRIAGGRTLAPQPGPVPAQPLQGPCLQGSLVAQEPSPLRLAS